MSSSSSRTSTLFTIAGVTALGGLVAYAVYFDYKRRTDDDFRRKLRKEKKKAKSLKSDTEAAQTIKPEQIRAALLKVRDEALPTSVDEKEQYFLASVDAGERLCGQGPMFQLEAALSFYRALRVYPSPVDLVMIYQKTVPPPVFKIVMDMMQLDVSEPPASPKSAPSKPRSTTSEEGEETSPTRTGPPSETSSQEWDNVTDPGSQPAVQRRIEDYYDFFPAKHMNVSVHDGPLDLKGVKRKIIKAEKDFAPGDVIYKEEPLVAILDLDLQGQGTHCTYCLRHIQKGMAIKPDNDRLDSVYCSKDCQVKCNVQSQNLLFSLEPYLPPELDAGVVAAGNNEERDTAQAAFAKFIKSKGKSAPLMSARFVGRQVAMETAKMVPGHAALAELPRFVEDGNDYGLYDHIERLRFIEPTVEADEVTLLRKVLAAALPGLETAVNDEQYAMWKGKMLYNAYGICYGGGRDDKPPSTDRPEDQERTRTPYGTSRQIGSGLYPVSAYLRHSCSPNARPSFSNGTSELHLIASSPLKKGDEITVSYVDTTQHADETAEEARRRRRVELARGWKFKCECERCLKELDTKEVAAELELGVGRDESKVERTAERLAKGTAFPARPLDQDTEADALD
ncbi:MAS20-domain-containing protein [Cristinia sonorae]|uniref:MAS20-domain-containing protein n=1 Tax=Cristinia sonorae TaxID=1940300 RepID=A0A8K0UY95_9AGAR|nr:MAS20-domain-containing protein [Cristinia sonorae]